LLFLKQSNSLRTSIVKNIENSSCFKPLLLTWAQQFREVVFMDSNEYPLHYSSYDCILAVDALTAIKTDSFNAFEDLKQYQQTTKDWLFGYLSYDLKNDVETLESNNFDGLHFPDLFFFQPKKIFLLRGNQLEIQYLRICDDEIEDDFKEICAQSLVTSDQLSSFEIKQRISKENYLEKTSQILDYIHRGDIYEANFCMEFYAENAIINPIEKFNKLNSISKSPFSVFLKNNNHFLLSASPERYIKKEGENLISQPIKGTAKRFEDRIEDEKSKNSLALDPKERSENIMVSDLVRNDLSKTAQKGSVNVEELCEIYSFEQVHQMISTITSKLDSQYSVIDAIKASFPMGSMTGTPKVSVMKIIDTLEETKRGLYSGSVGYFTPNNDFDFNVVIRSILYFAFNS
jgi:para-aminobenzoate synthetase component 1